MEKKLKKTIILLKVAVVVLFSTVSPIFSADSDWQFDRKLAIGHMINRNCDQAWKILWESAQTGRKEALNTIALGIYTHGMSIPGAMTDKLSMYRYIFIFLTYGLSNQADTEKRLLNELFGEVLFPKKSGHPFGECLRNSTNISSCTDVAISERLVPSFSDFVSEVNNSGGATNQKSICLFNVEN
ncbi:MAG: hypothetical protein NXI27_00180 [Alphaproteobacteria bacterium]|nr:hypothetical protein [Alphaproteobacteria bacterium]